MHEWVKGIYYRMKDGVVWDPRKRNFQHGRPCCDWKKKKNCEIEKNPQNKWFSLQYSPFPNWRMSRKQMRTQVQSERTMRLW